MNIPSFASSSTASSSRTPLRRRPNPDQALEAIANGAYLSQPSYPSIRRDKGKGKARDTPRRSLIPGHPIGTKGWVREAFRLFGEHCARNQIRTLLIDCLVMTNLFYPALSIYLQKRFPPLHPPTSPSHNSHRLNPHLRSKIYPSGRRKEHPLSLLSTPVLDTFFPYPPPLLPPIGWAGWWDGHHEIGGEWLATHEGEDGGDDELRILRVGWADVGDVLDRDEGREEGWSDTDFDILDLVRKTAEGWEDGYRDTGEGCLRRLEASDGAMTPTGACYLLATGDLPSVTSLESIRGSNGTAWLSEEEDLYQSVGVLFRIPRSSVATFDDRWTEAIELAAKEVDAEVFLEPAASGQGLLGQQQVWHLSFHPESDSDRAHSHDDNHDSAATPKSVLLLYLVLFSFLGHQLTAATKVHSRFGLAFTGIVQLCCSAVMSFSVLAILGWNGWGWGSGHGPSLPTYILPFVIVVVGAENMSALTKAVFSVPFSYSVPVRIGLGLSKVGSTIASTSLTRLVVLLLIWLFVNLRPVREFCLFAAVVIITDWFMLHTFFLTVLSIDAQRLELADVLTSNGGVTPAPVPKDEAEERIVLHTGWNRAFRAAANKLGSLIFILISIGFIYYYTERNRSPLSTPSLYGYNPTSATTAVATAFSTSPSAYAGLTTAARLWRSINPLGLSSLRIVIPPANILILPRLGHPMLPADLRKLAVPTSRILLPRLKPFFYVFKVLVLPQAVTAGALYSLLLFLLKDADLLDAQRNRLGRNEKHRSTDVEDTDSVAKALRGVKVHLLPCSHEVDVDLVASSLDGKLVVSVGIDNTVCLWRLGESAGMGTREILRHDGLGSDDQIIDVSLSHDGSLVAVITEDGALCQWRVIVDEKPVPRETINLHGIGAISIRIIEMRHTPEDPFIARPASPTSEKIWETLVVCADASVISISTDGEQSVVISGSNNTARALLVDHPTSTTFDVAILICSLSSLTLYRKSDAGWYGVEVPATTSARLTCASISNDRLALGYRKNLVEVFDLSGTPLAAIGAGSTPTDGIKQVALANPASTQCTTCGMVSTDSLFIVSSTSDKVHIDRLSSRGTVSCRCPRRGSLVEDYRATNGTESNGSPARLVIPPTASRTGMTPGASPQKSPSLLPPISNGEFPLSSHGTRRLSALHRDDASPGFGAAAGLSMTPSSPESDTEVLPLGAVLAPGGGSSWCIVQNRVVGLRRVYGGIDDAQWEVWSIDLETPWNGSQLVVDALALTDLLSPAPVIPDSGVRAQRAERLLSISGRAPFPSLGASFSVSTFAPLAYTEIRPFYHAGDAPGAADGKVVIGMGNRLGVMSVPGVKVNRKKASSGHLSVGLGIGGMGVTPPPPLSVRRDLGEAKKAL